MVIDFNSLYDMPKDVDRVIDMFRKSLAFHKQNFPMVNVTENDSAYVVDACLPGVALEDMELTLTPHNLVIQAERTAPAGRYFRQERLTGRVQRVIALNVPVVRDAVTAKASNGILRVTLPKAEKATSRKITIEG